MDAISTALSGLNASTTRLAVSANNIANAHSTTTLENGQAIAKPFVPQQVNQSALQSGGVSTSLSDVTPPSVTVFAPEDVAANEHGFVQLPNVNLDQEVANQLLATNTYKANLSVIKRENQVFESLLDITG